MTGKRFRLYNLILSLVLFIVLEMSFLYSQQANTNWGKITKKIAVYPSLNDSAWLGKGIVTNMVPVGDGTYEVKLNLTPGQIYNYIFFAQTDDNPPDGLYPNSTYYDQVPTLGNIPTSKNSNVVQYTNYAYYGAVGENRDARRIIKVPDTNVIHTGEKFYVFNNFSDSPKPPDKVEALPGDKQIILHWYPAKGQWNIEDINVKIGGKYRIYYNSTGADSNFSLLTEIDGNITSYTHTGLVNGTTYYYVIVAVDAYLGSKSSPFPTMTSDLPVTNGTLTAQSYATPNSKIPVYFKVENIDMEVVKKNDYLVWLTPSDKDGRFYYNKLPGRMAVVKLRQLIKEEK